MATYTHKFDTATYKGTSTIQTGLFINGEWTAPIEGGEIEVVNPATGEVITKVAGGTKADVDKAVAAARKAFKTSWGFKVSGKERGRLLNNLASLVEKHGEELSALETLDVGKLYKFSKIFDITGVVDVLRYYAGWADKLNGTTVESDDDKLGYTRREPYGVCGQITPWNYPMFMLSWKIAPALATGNVVVLKPSEVTPLSSLRFAELIAEAGFPPGVFNLINGYGASVGQAMSEHPQIDKVAFTGSTMTGRRIMKAAAESNLKAVTLELGGKSPVIIFDDANLGAAVNAVAGGIFFNSGQSCAAGSRLFVQEGIYDTFIQAFTQAGQYFGSVTGDPFHPDTTHGPVVSKAQHERVLGYIAAGKEEGATVLLGGEKHGDKGYFIQPTIFTDVTNDMKIAREEIFGPVMVIIKFKDEAEVLEMANDTTYGLAAYVFTQNMKRSIKFANGLEAGTVCVNTTISVDIRLPFGGYKNSGLGKECGQWALDSYTQQKAIHINLADSL